MGARCAGVTPYNGPYGDASPERGTFFRFQVYERLRVSLVNGYEEGGGGDLSCRSVRGLERSNRRILWL